VGSGAVDYNEIVARRVALLCGSKVPSKLKEVEGRRSKVEGRRTIDEGRKAEIEEQWSKGRQLNEVGRRDQLNFINF